MSHPEVNHRPRTASPLRMRRVELGLTQAELASAAGRSREQVSRIETGLCDPHVSTLRAYAGVLDCDVTELVEAYNDHEPGTGLVGKDGGADAATEHRI